MAKNVFSEVTVTLTFDHQILISSSSSPSERLCQIWGNSLGASLSCCVHETGTDGQTNWKRHASGDGCRLRGDIKTQSISTVVASFHASFNLASYFLHFTIPYTTVFIQKPFHILTRWPSHLSGFLLLFFTSLAHTILKVPVSQLLLFLQINNLWLLFFHQTVMSVVFVVS